VTATVQARPVLADLIPAGLIPTVRQRTVALVVAGALFTALASQIRIPLGFTPVPINLGTFAVVLTGGALGARRGVASIGVFLAFGLVGLPFFAGANSGWTYATGSTGGYLLAYPVMAAIVGYAADRGRDRNVAAFTVAVVAANLVVYVLGALWLAHVVDVPVLGTDGSAFSMGVRPFLAGDVAKMVAAGLLFPTAWRLVGDR